MKTILSLQLRSYQVCFLNAGDKPFKHVIQYCPTGQGKVPIYFRIPFSFILIFNCTYKLGEEQNNQKTGIQLPQISRLACNRSQKKNLYRRNEFYNCARKVFPKKGQNI